MSAARVVASLPALARSDRWAATKKNRAFTIAHGDEQIEVSIVEQHKVGHLVFYFAVCPACGHMARDLVERDGKLGCRRCLRVLHPDQALSGSKWNRQVVRPARHVARIDERLQRRDLDRNHRRRLRRRRQRLLRQVEEELAQRQLDVVAKLAAIGFPLYGAG